MSDFLFSSRRRLPGELASCVDEIFLHEKVERVEYHGPWGSLCVAKSRYPGFDVVETDEHICVVIGGPVLYFREKGCSGDQRPDESTWAVLRRWRAGTMDWSNDLSGPFVVLIIDKSAGTTLCITDLMMFIPVYEYSSRDEVVLGTHVDAVASAVGRRTCLDQASLVDFILHYVVTFPYTIYEDVQQLQPATEHLVSAVSRPGRDRVQRNAPYWLPEESFPYRSLTEAAQALRSSIQDYLDRVVASFDHVGQFVSGGEDSRVLSGMLPEKIRRDAFVFLDGMNREGKIAQKVARMYGSEFRVDFRKPGHYLEILPEAAALVGSGHQYFHAHSLCFNRKHDLGSYPAVFGGYIADALYKAIYAKKPKLCQMHAFIPEFPRKGETRSHQVRCALFPDSILSEVTRRRRAHLELVQGFRPTTAHEWFVLWPMTMRIAIPNLYCNRRLFASYEPFMANDAVKVSAAVPTSWKMNRRLFRKAFLPYLAKSRWLPHADGRMPYLPWWLNAPLQFSVQLFRKVAGRFGYGRGNQGPWNDWSALAASNQWEDSVASATSAAQHVPVLSEAVAKGAFVAHELDVYQKANLLQLCLHTVKDPAT